MTFIFGVFVTLWVLGVVWFHDLFMEPMHKTVEKQVYKDIQEHVDKVRELVRKRV